MTDAGRSGKGQGHRDYVPSVGSEKGWCDGAELSAESVDVEWTISLEAVALVDACDC